MNASQKSVKKHDSAINVLIVAVPETAGSALYGMLDVLSSVGSIWQELTRSEALGAHFQVRVVSPGGQLFSCGNGVPVNPDFAVEDDPRAEIIILPEMWLGPDQALTGQYPELIDWIRRSHRRGSFVYSACSGAVMLAETGLLDGRSATSHWGYVDLFRQKFPKVRFDPAPNLVYADADGQVVTAGGTTSWHDLALHIISRHVTPGEAMRIAKVYLLKWHDEGDLPYASLTRSLPHGDAAVRLAEEFLKTHYQQHDALPRALKESGLAERSLKRRFKAATGVPLIEYLQNLRIETAKEMLDSGKLSVEDIAAEVGYADTSFFRRLFKRLVGITPLAYRKMWQRPSVSGV